MALAHLAAPVAAAPKHKETGHENRVRQRDDRRQKNHEQRLDRDVRDKRQGAAEGSPRRGRQQHVDDGRDLRRKRHQHHDGKQQRARAGLNWDVLRRRRVGQREQNGADGGHGHPGRRAEIHLDREGQVGSG